MYNTYGATRRTPSPKTNLEKTFFLAWFLPRILAPPFFAWPFILFTPHHNLKSLLPNTIFNQVQFSYSKSYKWLWRIVLIQKGIEGQLTFTKSRKKNFHQLRRRRKKISKPLKVFVSYRMVGLEKSIATVHANIKVRFYIEIQILIQIIIL